MRVTIEINVGSANFTQFYTVCETRAPKSYDYQGVIQLDDGGFRARIVAIPEKDMPTQAARYASGMYFASPVSEWADEDTLLGLIISRLVNCHCQ